MIDPINDRVVVKPDAVETKTPGGIHLPPPVGKQRDKAQTGTVVAVGPGTREQGTFKATTIRAGDRVIFGPFSGHEVEYGGNKLVVLREDEIFGKVK